METWLSRSGDCPLSLILSDFPAQDLLLRQFLHIAVPHCQRWEHVELTVPFKHLFLIQGEMPLLSYLKLGLSQFTGHDGSPTLRLFDRAPQLKRLSLPRYFHKSVICLPWAQLTHLNGRFFDAIECMEILRDAMYLVHCKLRILLTNETMPSLTIIHPHLRHLALLGTAIDTDLSKLLDNLTAPALRSLALHEPSITLDSLNAFISRSHCTLEELRIHTSSLSQSVYREAFPSIRNITLEPVDR
jgi:hypothetical protein